VMMDRELVRCFFHMTGLCCEPNKSSVMGFHAQSTSATLMFYFVSSESRVCRKPLERVRSARHPASASVQFRSHAATCKGEHILTELGGNID
jgi:hypothetical protein